MQATQLDHIILLLPRKDLVNPPAWLTDNFVLTPGGRHADGKTENKLIIFEDGTYIELIAFVEDNPSNRHGHWWGDKSHGFIDYALTSPNRTDLDAVRRRVETVNYIDETNNPNHAIPSSISSASYAPSVEGGRTGPEGQVIRWHVTFPDGVRRGQIPFWCHDVTPRGLRVPVDDRGAMRHPSGAVGVGAVTVVVPEGMVDGLGRLNGAVVDQAPVRGVGMRSWEWRVGLPVEREAREGAVVRLEAPREEWQRDAVERHGVCISRVGLLTEKPEAGPLSILESVGEGRIQLDFIESKRR